MKKKNILKENCEFTKIINTSRNKKNKYYSIYYKKNNYQYNRYGISIPKKTGKAVVRNKIKRQLKNIIDNNEFYIQTPYDYVIIIRKSILELNYQLKETELTNLLKKIGEQNEKTNN
jgi:ribonuclease P protein component